MENIRSIKERIRSCVSCGESQCPFIKERFDNHVTSHHFACKRSLSRPQVTPCQQWYKIMHMPRTDISDSKLDQHTSTSNLIVAEEPEAVEELRTIILECVKDIINQESSDVIQNIINEFVERVRKLSLNDIDGGYEHQLDVAIDEFISSLPLNIDQQEDSIMKNLKRIIAAKINEFHKKNTGYSNKQNKKPKLDYLKNNFTSTDCNEQSNAEERNNDNDNAAIPLDSKNVNTQVSNSFASNFLYTRSKTKGLDKYNMQDKELNDDNSNLKDTDLKKIMKAWLVQLNYEADLSISYTNIKCILEELYNRLLPLLNTKSDVQDIKLVLQEEILSFLTEYFNILFTKTNVTQLTKCAGNLAILLLIEKSKIKPLLNDIVTEYLDQYHSGYKSAIIKKTIIDFLSQNLFLIQRQGGNELKFKLFMLLKSLTDLPEIIVIEIATEIVNRIKSIAHSDMLDQNNSSTTDSKDNNRLGNIISVFKSETELLDRSSNPSIHRRKSSIIKKKKTNNEMQMYIEKLGDVIMAWINTLPQQKHKKSNKIKETLGNKLIEDILDQVKLEQIAPETSMEKDKYLFFFINRWLNRYDYFDNISDAKPYAEQLIEQIKVISVPNSQTSQKDNPKELPGISLEDNALSHGSFLLSHENNKFSYELTHWINEQPFQFFFISNKSVTKELNHKFASKLQAQINNLSSEIITKEIHDWLAEVIKPEHKDKIPALAETLKNKIDNLLPGKNINDSHEQEVNEQTINKSQCCDDNITNDNLGNTAKELITTFIEHKYDSENFIAREACVRLVKRELQRLCALCKLDPSISTNTKEHETSIEKLSKELQYIKIISDSLKSLPSQESFSNTEYSVRAEQVNTLANIISDIDENKDKLPDENNYNYRLTLIISEFFKKLPVPSHLEDNLQVSINDLINRILAIQQLSPCCQNTLQSTHLSNTDIADPTLSDYIEAYILENDDELFEDDIKLQACISRLFSEMKNSAVCSTSYDIDNMTKKQLSSHETVTHFILKMKNANEISDWLSNLPLLPLTDKASQNQLVDMINTLAEKMTEGNRTITDLDTNIDKELIDYMSNWISKLPLDTNKEISFIVVIQQLINRMKKINNGNTQQNNHIKNITCNVIDKRSSSAICDSCCNKNNISRENRDPGTVIVETIEEWCNSLPIKAENESMSETLKQNVATKLYQKLGELNMNPEYFNNNILFKEMLSEEIDLQLQNLPQNSKLQDRKKELKKKLLDRIIALRKEIKNKTTGVEYKHDLEKTIEISMPYPVRTSSHREDSPGFQIYKDRLATMFILENFDHGNDAIKLNYEKRIRNEIDKYFLDVQVKNSVPLTKDQIYNDLYSALFNVPLPNESSMIDEVEEIKTRCEIDNWFETLPLREATGVGELLTWDQILSMLAKRLHEFEKYDKDCDDKIHKEITKWLLKLPLLPDQANNVDYFANDLQQRLKSTAFARRHIPRNCNKSQKSVADQSKSTLNLSEVDISSSDLCFNLPSSMSTCCLTSSTQKPKKIAGIILDIVETWCYQLPLPANTPQEKDIIKVIKDNLVVKIIMKISEININPETSNDDFLYDSLLDVEIENLMSKLPESDELNQCKSTRKKQLKDAIMSVKPFIKEERARYEYKIEIKNTVDKLLQDHFQKNTQNKILFDSLKEEIADHFIIYNFHKHDEESSWKHKTFLLDSVEKYFTLLDKDSDKTTHIQHRDPLLIGNQLLCELARIPAPGENAMQEEIHEIQIKFELTKLFSDLTLTKDKDKLAHQSQIKITLAKQIIDLIKEGDTCDNYRKIKEYVIMNLKKINDNIDLNIVDMFLKQLKLYISKHNTSNYCSLYENEEKQKLKDHKDISNEKEKETKWFSLLPDTTKSHDEPFGVSESRKTMTGFENLKEEIHVTDINKTDTSYENFANGTFLSSSTNRENDLQFKANPNGKLTEMNSNQNASPNTSISQKTLESSINQNQANTKFAQTLNSISSQPQSEQQNQPNSLSEHLVDHQNLVQNNFGQANETQHTQRTEHQPNFLKSIPDPQTSGFIYKPNQFSMQSKSTMMSQIPTQTQGSKYRHNQLNSPKPIQEDRFLINSQDGQGSGNFRIRSPEPQDIPAERRTPFRDIGNSSSFIPFVSIPSQTQPPLSYSKGRGQSCRRPSITILSPTGSQIRNGIDQISQTRCTSNELLTEDNFDATCECMNRRKRPNVCSAHMQRHCQICNGFNPYYCRVPSFRYPTFYYH